MRVLLATIGSRGEVQPVLALARRLLGLGQEVRVCVPPDFVTWIEELGIPATPLGPPMRPTTDPGGPGTWDLSSPEGRRQAAQDAVSAQFATLSGAADGCDVLVATGSVMVAGRSVTEMLGIDYLHAHYCPATLASAHHPPAPWPGWPQHDTGTNDQLWQREQQRWNDTWASPLNDHRATVGLAPVENVRSHVVTDRPWLAADPTLGPWPEPADPTVLQTGAWMLPDQRPLPDELETFLAAGAAPVYFGLGSMRAPGRDLGQVLTTATRALGRRAIISAGWAGLTAADSDSECLVIGETNHQALFQRVAAAVHHGGAGTTTTAARAATPQVLIPQVYDQHYWAARIDHLGIGVAHPPGMPSAESLTAALEQATTPAVTARARALAPAIRTDGATTAARHLIAQAGRLRAT